MGPAWQLAGPPPPPFLRGGGGLFFTVGKLAPTGPLLPRHRTPPHTASDLTDTGSAPKSPAPPHRPGAWPHRALQHAGGQRGVRRGEEARQLPAEPQDEHLRRAACTALRRVVRLELLLPAGGRLGMQIRAAPRPVSHTGPKKIKKNLDCTLLIGGELETRQRPGAPRADGGGVGEGRIPDAEFGCRKYLRHSFSSSSPHPPPPLLHCNKRRAKETDGQKGFVR